MYMLKGKPMVGEVGKYWRLDKNYQQFKLQPQFAVDKTSQKFKKIVEAVDAKLKGIKVDDSTARIALRAIHDVLKEKASDM